MPKRRRLWSSWNYLGSGGETDASLSLTYWMNKLQPLGDARDLFVTLNPNRAIEPGSEIAAFDYSHPIFDQQAMAAQHDLWNLQGRRKTWFCGSYFGYGFHEDGLQSGLAAAEDIGGVRRPWSVANESGRIHLGTRQSLSREIVREAAE
jgi:predicted NAD/FAD-binding protein